MTGQAPAVRDVFVVGGGINGCAIARDAAGRGLSVHLVEMGDLAQATSSASTKLFHGGLRYLEYFEFKLVRESLVEREVLLRAMPHISWPMRFVLPYHPDMRFDADTPTSKLLSRVMPWMKGRRPAWLIRLGLFMYDGLGGRKVLPATRSVDLTTDPAGKPLKPKFERAFEYSDCWVEDSRLVALTARDAEARGAAIETRTRLVSAERGPAHWTLTLEAADSGATRTARARVLVNAAGPWVEEVVRERVRLNTSERIRLVRGSHIVTRKLFDHDRCYFFQGTDGRIIFAIPYETDFTLIGTTDREHTEDPLAAHATEAEQDYLCRFASEYFETPVTREDIVWTYSGVRPLYDDGATSATAATRDFVLSMDAAAAPVLSVFGGKITTHRRLAEDALKKIVRHFPQAGAPWTAGVPLPGGDFPVDGRDALTDALRRDFPFLTDRHALRLVKAYGTEARQILDGAQAFEDLGRDFGATLTEREVAWLMDREYARTAEDAVWRRSKLGLRLDPAQVGALDAWMAERRARQMSAAE
ncbi:glycerol-3-phosphate dehydrogenase [Rhodobacteraceae bacterium 2CG4]|uniref:Glycerol-3-phosphate dehydrogenase n=1 Tax=Halovulum marinum TaxID=2662447 RepID=A0A6L5YW61_9RHOB|nr:glycerol-3-phosphate dehydrogenase [Halovulum marinum]MSU88065.1 glycerol-3-phosphate dehydrogenase [Halovulum marinum]